MSLTSPATPQSSSLTLCHRNFLRATAHAPAATLATTGRRCDSRVGPLPRVSARAGDGLGSPVLLRLGYIASDTDNLVRRFSPLLVPSLILCADMASVLGCFFAGNHKRDLRYLMLLTSSI